MPIHSPTGEASARPTGAARPTSALSSEKARPCSSLGTLSWIKATNGVLPATKANPARPQHSGATVASAAGVKAMPASARLHSAKPPKIHGTCRRGANAAISRPPATMPAPRKPCTAATCAGPWPKCCLTSSGTSVKAGITSSITPASRPYSWRSPRWWPM